MNKTQRQAAKWDKVWNFIRSIGCQDQLGIDQSEIAARDHDANIAIQQGSLPDRPAVEPSKVPYLSLSTLCASGGTCPSFKSGMCVPVGCSCSGFVYKP